MLLLGPIVVRIVYEMIMMFILLVQNTTAIRNKLCDDDDDQPAPRAAAPKKAPKEYVFCSYLVKLLPADGMGHHGELHLSNGVIITQGCNTSLGIMASSPNRDGAWRFVKTFMQGESEPYLSEGIPVFRESFEQAVENTMQRKQSNVDDYESFNEQDAAAMRKLVYGTDRLVIRDEAVTGTIQKQIEAFLGGAITAEQAAKQIQSRMSLYMAEQYGG